MSEILVEVEKKIDIAIAQGWRLPKNLAMEIANGSPESKGDQEEWLCYIVAKLSILNNLPRDWKNLEKAVLINDLLTGRRRVYDLVSESKRATDPSPEKDQHSSTRQHKVSKRSKM
jgi:hypothetical protein